MRRAILLLTLIPATVLLAAGVALAAVITCPTGPGDECQGTDEADKITGSQRADKIDALAGNDNVLGRSGGDDIYMATMATIDSPATAAQMRFTGAWETI